MGPRGPHRRSEKDPRAEFRNQSRAPTESTTSRWDGIHLLSKRNAVRLARFEWRSSALVDAAHPRVPRAQSCAQSNRDVVETWLACLVVQLALNPYRHRSTNTGQRYHGLRLEGPGCYRRWTRGSVMSCMCRQLQFGAAVCHTTSEFAL